jgi:hypothetical protein
MSSSSDFEYINGQLFLSNFEARPESLGRGPATIRGSAYLQGPIEIGNDRLWPNIAATLMVGPLKNSDSPTPRVGGSFCGTRPSNPSLYVVGNSVIKANLFVTSDILSGRNITAQGDVKSQCGAHVLSRKKNFDIPHPSREGWRLRHTCPEGPTNDVYIRGRVTSSNEIDLPPYWKDFVYPESITVSLTPVGSHQDVIIKRIDSRKVYLQSKGNMPIDCFYHIFAERKDGERLIPEYKGNSPEDYPGNNDEYSVSGFHYDRKK